MASLPEIDIKTAQFFLDTIAGWDNRSFTFQTFLDSPSSTSKNLTRILHGTLEEHAKTLCDYNREGAGIFVTVNETDLRGRKKENIVAVRALFLDFDDGTEPEFTLSPSLIVRSKRGIQPYWLLKPGESLEKFEGAQSALIRRFGSDQAVKDLSRVMRMPGFLHMKNPDDPFPVTIEYFNDVRYTIEELLSHYGKGLDPVEPRGKTAEYWRDLASQGPLAGSRNGSVTQLAGYLLRRYVDPPLALELIQCWNAVKGQPPLSTHEVMQAVNSVAGRELRRRTKS